MKSSSAMETTCTSFPTWGKQNLSMKGDFHLFLDLLTLWLNNNNPDSNQNNHVVMTMTHRLTHNQKE